MPSPSHQQDAALQPPPIVTADIPPRSSTPPRPSYSPVTPTISQAALFPAGTSARQPVEWMDDPEPVPLNLDENPDAIALHSALGILQVQRQNNLRAIRHLRDMKAVALQHPQAFVDDLKAGKLSDADTADDIDADESDDDAAGGASGDAQANRGDGGSRFGKFPPPQTIVRCPPINWAKYHIVGEPLDRLHQEQRRRPGAADSDPGTPQRDHVIAAPYSPFVDKLGPRQTQHGSTK